jgi:MFS family permease
MMLMAVMPLVGMPGVNHAPSAVPRTPWRSLLAALVDRPYRRLLAFNCWLAFVQGATGAAQALYPIRVLGLSYPKLQGWYGVMFAGQSGIAPWMGRLVDRFGSRPVMIVTGLIVAAGPLFFLFSTPQRPWLVGGAFVAWIAYAGLNVGLDNIKLKLAPADNNAPYLAVYHATGELANGIAAVGGGMLFDVLTGGGPEALRVYAYLFFSAWIARTMAVALVARLIEPEARGLLERERIAGTRIR